MSELLKGRHEQPVPRHPHSLLALYKKYFFTRCLDLPLEIGDHRSNLFNWRSLLLCRPLIESISDRTENKATLDSGTVHKPLLELCEIAVIDLYGPWIAEQSELNVGARNQLGSEKTAETATAQHLSRCKEGGEAEAYHPASILSKEDFGAFPDGLKRSGGDPRNVSTLAFGSRRDSEHTNILVKL